MSAVIKDPFVVPLDWTLTQYSDRLLCCTPKEHDDPNFVTSENTFLKTDLK